MELKRSIKMLTIAALCLAIGVAIAYYNTASFGYDNANILSLSNDWIRIFDITIEFDKIRNIVEVLKNIAPDNYITI